MKLLRISLLVSLPFFTQVADAQKPANSAGHPGHALWPKMKPSLGEMAPDFTLHDLDEKEFRLKDHLGKRPIVIEFGSYS